MLDDVLNKVPNLLEQNGVGVISPSLQMQTVLQELANQEEIPLNRSECHLVDFALVQKSSSLLLHGLLEQGKFLLKRDD